MKQYTDDNGNTQFYSSDTELVQILISDIRNIKYNNKIRDEKEKLKNDRIEGVIEILECMFNCETENIKELALMMAKRLSCIKND